MRSGLTSETSDASALDGIITRAVEVCQAGKTKWNNAAVSILPKGTDIESAPSTAVPTVSIEHVPELVKKTVRLMRQIKITGIQFRVAQRLPST